MRGILVLVLLAATTLSAQAQTTSRFAFISVPEVEVRAGRSLDPKIYPTNRLRFNETIEVIDEKDGWVGIKPPRGSFSWIDRSKVDTVAGSTINYVVTGPAGTKSVETLIGSELNGEKMPIICMCVFRRVQPSGMVSILMCASCLRWLLNFLAARRFKLVNG